MLSGVVNCHEDHSESYAWCKISMALLTQCSQPMEEVRISHHESVQMNTAGVQKFHLLKSDYHGIVNCHECHSESYTYCIRHYCTFHSLYKAFGKSMASANRALFNYIRRMNVNSVGGSVIIVEW